MSTEDSTTEAAPPGESEAEKNSDARVPLKRETNGRFAVGNAGRRPGAGRKDPTFRELAAAQRQHNIAHLIAVRDDPDADPELRFEAVKLMVAYDAGKPVTHSGPAVQVNVASPAASVSVGASGGGDFYRAAMTSDNVDDVLGLIDARRALAAAVETAPVGSPSGSGATQETPPHRPVDDLPAASASPCAGEILDGELVEGGE